MRAAPILDFPVDEYENRFYNLIGKIKEAECAVILLTNEENLRYFCGYRSAAWNSEFEYPAMMMISAEGKMALITSDRRRAAAISCSCLEEDQILSFPGFGEIDNPDAFVPAIVSALDYLGVTGGKLGTETGLVARMRISYSDYQNIFSNLPSFTPFDFAKYIFDLREIKSPREIDVMRKCCFMAADAFKIAMDKIELGKTTEEDMFRDYIEASFDLGADDMEYILIVEFGPDRRQPNCMPGPRVYETDDWCVFFDSGPAYKGYVSDIIRIGKLSEPTKAQADFYKISVDCHRECIAKVKPGYKIGDLCKHHDDFMREHGVFDICLTVNSGGHGVGVDIHEMPVIKDVFGDKTFEAGMVFAFEPTIIHPVEGQIVLENNYLVTENGVENLTPQIQDFIYVPQKD